MKRLVLAAVLLAACQGKDVIEETQQASVFDPPSPPGVPAQQLIHTVEDLQGLDPASFDALQIMNTNGLQGLTYYYGFKSVGVSWQYWHSGMPAWLDTSDPPTPAGVIWEDLQVIGTGQRGCVTGVGCVALSTLMQNSSIIRHSAYLNRGYRPPTLPAGSTTEVLMRRRWRYMCPNFTYAKTAFATSNWISLKSSASDVYKGPVPPGVAGVMVDPNGVWKQIATECGYGAEAFSDHEFVQCDCTLPSSARCFVWPHPSTCGVDSDLALRCSQICAR